MYISPDIILLIGLAVIVALLALWNIILARRLKTLFRGSTGAALEKVIEAHVNKTTKLEGEAKDSWKRSSRCAPIFSVHSRK